MKFRVNSVALEPITQEVTLESGQKVEAQVQGLVVEMVEVDGKNTFTRRFIPADMADALELYAQDAVIVVTFQPDEE